MLVTWNARASLSDTPVYKNATFMPPAMYDPWPEIDLAEYNIIILVLGGAHNLFCGLVLLTYFLSNHPTLPKISVLVEKIRNICSRKAKEDAEEEKVHESKLEVQFFSFTTFYYLVFLGMSVLGTIFKGYFFAFHLLNIVNNNQLLRGVIQAVTQNGKSLVWVAVLGFVVFYLYGLVSFALLRSSFDPDEALYCATLWQCTITVIRYGLVGGIFDKLKSHSVDNTFTKFGFLVIFHLSFFIFITTIGLNIIFGIIVDTFSELRDLKWTAERDMRDTCFICSRGSYDFEHHGMGFDHHINNEHHIWAYIFFFIHLHDTKQCDYTSLELYVFRLLHQEKFDFFPLNRALSLSVMDEGSTDSKVDDLLRYVLTLVERQREEDAKNKREEERQKQLRWREENRSALLQPGRSQTEMISTSDSQSNSIGQLLRQKRWHQDIKQSKMQHSQDSNLTEHRRPNSRNKREKEVTGLDLLSDKNQDFLTEFMKSGSDVYSPHSETKSSPHSGTGWPGHKTYSSTEGRSDDAPVRSIEFDDDEPSDGDLIKSPSPVFAQSAIVSVPHVSSSHSGIAPADYQEDYEHMLPMSLERIAQPDLGYPLHFKEEDRTPAIHGSLQSDMDRVALASSDAAGFSPSVSRRSSIPTVYSSKIVSSSYDQELDQEETSLDIRHSSHTDKKQRTESPMARRDSQQLVPSRRQTSRFGMEDFGLLTEDPFEITAPKAEFDEGLTIEGRAMKSKKDDRARQSRHSPFDCTSTDV